jgi:hypothetical protein
VVSLGFCLVGHAASQRIRELLLYAIFISTVLGRSTRKQRLFILAAGAVAIYIVTPMICASDNLSMFTALTQAVFRHRPEILQHVADATDIPDEHRRGYLITSSVYPVFTSSLLLHFSTLELYTRPLQRYFGTLCSMHKCLNYNIWHSSCFPREATARSWCCQVSPEDRTYITLQD